MTMTIFRDLPKKLVEEEILCHVPATYLKRLGSTCKRWNRLFNGDGMFARKHTDKAAKQFLVLMKTRENRICPTIFNLDGLVPSVEVRSELSLVDSHSAQFDISQVSHCDGLLLCTSEDESRFVVWNPFTGETRWCGPSNRLPQGRTFILGYYQEDNEKSYKVLSFIQGKKSFEIYEFSSDSWRILDDVLSPGWSLSYCFLSVSLKGSTYWFAIDETKAQRNISLLKFDFSTEKFVPVPLPYQCHSFAVTGLSVVKEEKLSVILQRDVTSKTEIWVTNKIDETTQVVSWSKVFAFDMSPDLQIYWDTNFLLDEEKKVVMICENWFDFEDETHTKNKDVISIVGEDNVVTQVDFGLKITDGGEVAILNYVPSLVQIERAGGKRKRGDLSLERPMMMTIFRDLPKDLVEEEILCHVLATYLKRLGSTCKQWNRLFNGDVRFARKHTDKAAKQFLVLMKTRENRICPTIFNLDGPVPSVEVKSELSLVDSHSAQFDISQVSHCDGLLLCTSEDESRFVVWNPFTGETRWFGPSNRRPQGYTFILGYYQEDNKKSYKVLSFIQGKKSFEIYEFSSNSWRILDDVLSPGWSLSYCFLSVSLKGSTYWFAIDETKAQRNISLLKFDFSTEKFVPVPLPYQCHSFAVTGLSVVKEEKLSVILQRDVTSKTEIWVTNKIDETTQVVSWSKVFAFDLSPDLQIAWDTNFLLDEEKKVVMICENWFYFEDETQTKNKDVISIVGEDNVVTQVDFGLKITDGGEVAILNYVPSLIQIERAGGKRKRGDL